MTKKNVTQKDKGRVRMPVHVNKQSKYSFRNKALCMYVFVADTGLVYTHRLYLTHSKFPL